MKSLFKQVEHLCITGKREEGEKLMVYYSDNRDTGWILMVYIVTLCFMGFISYITLDWTSINEFTISPFPTLATPILLYLTIRQGIRLFKFIKYLRSKNVKSFL